MTQYICLDSPWENLEQELNSIQFEVKTKDLNYATLKTVTPAVIWYTNNCYDLQFHVFQKSDKEDIHCLYANCPPELIDNIRRVNDVYLKQLSEAGKLVVYHGVHLYSHLHGDSLKFFLDRNGDQYAIEFEGKEDNSQMKTATVIKEMLQTKTLRCQFAFRMSIGIVKGNIVQAKAYLIGLRVAETRDEPRTKKSLLANIPFSSHWSDC